MGLIDFILPYVTSDITGIGGQIKETPEDFVVSEIPVYEPEGAGEHLFIQITKQGITTRDVQKALSRIYQTPRGDVNYAGIKDKHAVTTQFFSVWLKDGQDKDLAYQLEEELPVTINKRIYHRRKIKSGHLLGNQFSIRIRHLDLPVDEAAEKSREIARAIRTKGLPNFYGSQRFGMEGDNAQKGLEILLGQRREKNKWLRRFLTSSYQSYLFNYYLFRRIQQGLYQTILEGDIAKKHETGGIFVVEDREAEQQRFDKQEICYTGPVYGKKMTPAHSESARLEEQILEEQQMDLTTLRGARLTGTRRQGILIPEIEVEEETDSLRLHFSLPKGAFATIVLREFTKNF
ncbi:MAG: tRNA pseudouridine(13) synthase TruD [Bacteroidales bacterium]|nr:tRNA pseudouridine(13) synthase TruD [Bacteroidales bacterium]